MFIVVVFTPAIVFRRTHNTQRHGVVRESLDHIELYLIDDVRNSDVCGRGHLSKLHSCHALY